MPTTRFYWRALTSVTLAALTALAAGVPAPALSGGLSGHGVFWAIPRPAVAPAWKARVQGANLPDLIVPEVSAPSTSQPGQNIVVLASIRNAGRRSASAIEVAFYLASSALGISGATQLSRQNLGSLSAGAVLTISTALFIPSSISPGTFYVMVVADPTNAIRESNEANNTGASGAVAVKLAASPQMTAWVTDSLTRIQPTDAPGSVTGAKIWAARNEAEAFQVIIRAPEEQALSNVNVSISDLVGPSTLASTNITLYREHYVPVHVQSAHLGNGWAAPHAPGDWPDALIPSTVPGAMYPSFPFSVAAGRNQPIWVEIAVPKGTPAGSYTGTLTIRGDSTASITVPVTLTVWGFTLPDRPTLASDFGAYDHSFWIAYPYSTGADHDTLKANLYHAIRNHRLGIGVANNSDNLDVIMARQRFIEADPGMTDAQLAALKDYFVARGWGDVLAAYPVDEPQTQPQYDAVIQAAERLHALGIPVLTTIQNSIAWSALDGATDIWVPVFYECIASLQQIQAKLARGERVWSYAAGVQPNGSPTWLLDYDLIDYRIPAWLNYRHGQTGLLYWATAYWEAGNPWTNAANVTSNAGNGEGVLFYPGDKVGVPNAAIPSIRLKAIRDGVDDYDYLTLLAQLGDPSLAAQLSTALAPAWDSWLRDPTALATARARAAVRIVELGGQ